ncbi:hypothetical protein ABT282_32875 [Streptomyces sp. NPDC000927]
MGEHTIHYFGSVLVRRVLVLGRTGKTGAGHDPVERADKLRAGSSGQ